MGPPAAARGPEPSASAVRDGRAALWIALLAFAFHALFARGYVDNIDSRLHLASAMRLVETGSMSLAGTPEGTHRFARRTDDGRAYMQYGPGAAVPFLPAAAAVRVSGGAFGIADEKATAFLASFWSPAAGAAALALVYLILRRLGCGPPDAAWGAFLHGAGTYALFYARSTYYDGTLAALVLAAASAVLRDREGVRGPLLGGAFLAAALTMKVALVVLGPAFAALVILDGTARRGARLAAFAAFPALACAGLAWWNAERFGSPFVTGYGRYADLQAAAVPAGVVQQIAGPHGGWLLGNPALLLAIPGFVMLRRVRPALAACGALAFAALVTLAAAYVAPATDPTGAYYPLGGTSFGARYLLPATAFASIAAALAFARARAAAPTWARVMAITVVVASVVAQVPALVLAHQDSWQVRAALTPAEEASLPPRVVHDTVLAWEKVRGRDDPWDLSRVGGGPAPDGARRTLVPAYPALPGPAVWWARAATAYGRPWVVWGVVPFLALGAFAAHALRTELRRARSGSAA